MMIEATLNWSGLLLKIFRGRWSTEN